MNLENLTREELIIESQKRYKNSGAYTRRALMAQHILYQDYIWGEPKPAIYDDGFSARDDIDIDYNG